MPIRSLLHNFLSIKSALHRYLILRGANQDEADDILQEVSLKLSSNKIEGIESPRAYLYRMTNNHFLFYRRTQDRRMRREKDWMEIQSNGSQEEDSNPSIERDLIAREQLSILQHVIDELPERTRIIFRRFRIDGEHQKQIAEDLDISLSAVEKQLARAYEKIAAARLRVDEDKTLHRHLKNKRGNHEF